MSTPKGNESITMAMDGRPLPLLRGLEKAGGPREVSRQVTRFPVVPDDDRRRTEARAAILRELEDAALTILATRQARLDADSHAAARAEQNRAADREAKAASWKRAKVGNVDAQAEFFLSAGVGSVHAFNEVGRCGGMPAITAGASAGFVPAGGYLAVCVPVDAVDAFASKYALPDTLCWESGGKRVFVMRTGMYDQGGHSPVGFAGERFTLAAPVFRDRERCAPIDKPRWITPPHKVTLTDGMLPPCPDALARDLMAASGMTAPRAIDGLMLG